MRAPLYIRYVVHRLSAGSGKREGMLQVMYDVLRDDEESAQLRPALAELAGWFATNLRTPFHQRTSGFRVKRRPEGAIDPEPAALSWIKASAAVHLAKLRELQVLLEEAGWAVQELQTSHPGRVIYEDDHQIVAIPFADTST